MTPLLFLPESKALKMQAIDQYIDSLLESTPEHPLWNQEMILQGKKSSWNYIDGCMMTAFLSLFEKTGKCRYLDFVKDYIDHFIDERGRIKTYRLEDYNLDNINEGRVLFKLWDHFRDQRYRNAIEILYDQLQKQPRTSEGNFWHKKIYPDQVWLDGLYMAQPFYLEYEKRFNSRRNYNDILNQFRTVYHRMRDPESGLYYHAYDSSRQMFWCDKESGLSRNFWLRALGWYYMALVDLLCLLAGDDEGFFNAISDIFHELTDSILRYQHESGMWYQLVAMKDYEGNYLETSGSAILSYAILKAVKTGILPSEYKRYGETAFQGICEKYLKEKKGSLVLGGTCLVAGLGGKQRRSGTAEYYLSEPVVENEAKGIAPFILAYLNL